MNNDKAGGQESERKIYEIDRLNINEIIEANEKRKRELEEKYDPTTGVGCCPPRVEWKRKTDDGETRTILIPETMAVELHTTPCDGDLEWEQMRIKHDFEYWCATYVTILDKMSGRLVKMTLNYPQRRVLQILENQRHTECPLRLIMLKARQWGGSTLVQIYMAWIQLVLKKNWNSLICGHLLQTSAVIKSMYSRLLRNYRRELTPDGKKPTLKTFEGSHNVNQLSSSESLVITGSAQNQDAIRGYDVKMAHLSEVAFWPDTTLHSPEDVIRSISGSIPLEPLTLLVLESTANGVGNYFHNEWLRSQKGESDKKAVFVPWYEIGIYSLDVNDAPKLISELDSYEKQLWERGCTLEKINWYHNKRKEYPTHNLMMAEFPTTAIEAFVSTAHNVFPTEHIDRLNQSIKLKAKRGDIVGNGNKSLTGLTFEEIDSGMMEVWKMPESSKMRYRYVVAVDVGGRKDYSDWSVIAVFDRYSTDELGFRVPEIVAQWRGHTYHDLLAWKAAQIARFYCNALLVFESNTLECEGELGETILDEIKVAYHHVYHRHDKNNKPVPGFHTNRRSKQDIINQLVACVRDDAYIEHDQKAVDEMANYELDPNKGYGARKGTHDDILMTRAIGLSIINELRQNEGRSRAGSADLFINKEIRLPHQLR